MVWFKDWFGRDYLELYQHRSDEEASRQVEFILSTLPSSAANGRILDIACGRGRHVVQLARRNRLVWGVDLSSEALQLAGQTIHDENLSALVIRGDMRALPFLRDTFSVVLSMFTSFGYFDDDATHGALLAEWRRVLVKGGFLVIDYLNREHLLQSLVPISTRQTADREIIEHRSLSSDSKRIEKEIQIRPLSGGETSYFRESVRLYASAEMTEMLQKNGFQKIVRYGSFMGEPHTNDSERLILVAEAT